MKNGIGRFALADPMNDADANVEVARLIRQDGDPYIIGALVFTLSPIHDDAHYAEAARKMAASPDIDALYIKDPGGLLSPMRARTLIPAIRAVIGDKPLELHAHCTIGLGEQSYYESADLGIDALQCASGAAGDGTSNPPIERVVSNLRALGHSVDIDDEALAEVSRYFTALAQAEGLPSGHPMPFDATYRQHQLPGGMVGTMRRHLADHRVPHLEGAVVEELGRVREELGWPIVMTPFAQMVMTQAVMNVTANERYSVIPDEVIRYAIGKFGRPNQPIAPNVLDRIMALPRTKELAAEPDMADLPALRQRIGTHLSDEEFLLRATMPANLVDAMQAAGPAPRHYDPTLRPAMALIRQLLARTDVTRVSVEKAGFKLDLETCAP
jgi:oxaloacetate decarboxylase alpha subunit